MPPSAILDLAQIVLSTHRNLEAPSIFQPDVRWDYPPIGRVAVVSTRQDLNLIAL